MYQVHNTWIHPLHWSPLAPPHPIPRIVSTGIIFTFIYMCTDFFAQYSPLYPLFLPPPTFHWYQFLPLGTLLLFYLIGKKKRKGKKWHFFLFEIKVAIQGVSLWNFHINLYYNLNWLMSSNFLHQTKKLHMVDILFIQKWI
jgi:hypothetical protein